VSELAAHVTTRRDANSHVFHVGDRATCSSNVDEFNGRSGGTSEVMLFDVSDTSQRHRRG
jgi:hypothetical protein